MNVWLMSSFFAAAAVLMALESTGVPMTLRLAFKGDIKRESQWLAQFGQSVATAVAVALIFCFERAGDATPWHGFPGYLKRPVAVAAAVVGSSLCVYVIKRLSGRVRPLHERAGRFLGPSWKHANWRESFPSSHSTCAMALAVALSVLYPQAAAVFWPLGVITAALRYVMDAHWPSDVLAGMGVGYVVAHLVMRSFGLGN
ncbi:MAG TPA: phosphatase PAP2 family protein [Tepidisphaeraceae bacterium]|jgi:membrane-associated phospholipid phosphatase